MNDELPPEASRALRALDRCRDLADVKQWAMRHEADIRNGGISDADIARLLREIDARIRRKALTIQQGGHP